MQVYVTHIDTACMLLEINGYKILTDPTLDAPGRVYHHGFGTFSRKLTRPAITVEQLHDIDLVLLSHHQHKDNFDYAGKALAEKVALVISTPEAKKVMPHVMALSAWDTLRINTPKVPGLQVTATPAQHRPSWMPEFLSGTVIGFVITYDDQTDGCLYISGDTVYFNGINEIGKRFRVDIAFFNVGSVQFRYLTAFARYTMNGADYIKSAVAVNPNRIIPLHYQGWTHFKEGTAEFRSSINKHQCTLARTQFIEPGKRTRIK